MRKGELIQTADPKMIYNHPKTGFIAGFIGETNLIEGTFVGSDGRMCEVDTEIGRLKAHSECQLGAGAKVHVSLRPEAVRLSFDRAKPVAADNVFSGVISHLTYLGESEQFLLTPKSGSSLKATIFHAPEHDLAEGDKVYFGAMSADVLVLPFDPSVAKG
jgi:ABC-type Fe3+/spermidine/putrescine transport system ATPase subunit